MMKKKFKLSTLLLMIVVTFSIESKHNSRRSIQPQIRTQQEMALILAGKSSAEQFIDYVCERFNVVLAGESTIDDVVQEVATANPELGKMLGMVLEFFASDMDLLKSNPQIRKAKFIAFMKSKMTLKQMFHYASLLQRLDKELTEVLKCYSDEEFETVVRTSKHLKVKSHSHGSSHVLHDNDGKHDISPEVTGALAQRHQHDVR